MGHSEGKDNYVLLINPYLVRPEGSFRTRTQSCLPSLGLGYIASHLERNGFNVTIVDTQAEGITLESLPERLRRPGVQYKFIGITAVSSLIDTALEMARISKELFATSKVVLGGVHPTVLPDEVLETRYVDYVVRGEGEQTVLELVQDRRPDEILGLSYKEGNSVRHNEGRPHLHDLDALSFPAYHLLPMQNYHPTPGIYKRLPGTGVIASRGCPFKCTYCASQTIWGSGKRVRFRSAENVLEEITLLVDRYGVKEVFFLDDMLTANKSLVRELCEGIIGDDLDLTWVCMSRVDSVEEDTLRLMKRAGCHQICYGIESAEEQILENIQKKISLDRARWAVAAAKEAGLDVRTSFMLGNPGETEETMKKTIDFALSLKPTIASFNVTTPYPGTQLRRWAEENGYLTTNKYSVLESSQCILELPTVSAETVDRFAKIALRRFYYRPRYIVNRLLRMRSINDVKVVLTSATIALKILIDRARFFVKRKM